MMAQNSTTSKLDFLLLEEVSNESAEIISVLKRYGRKNAEMKK